MTASASQPKAVRNERRIIERPRLIKLLDETDARTILLLAPAGYGKTTLARQWAKTLNGAVWVTLTAAHRDVAVIATELARAVDPSGRGAHAFVATYVKAHSNPQRMSREVALVVADQLARTRTQWVVLDDYHEIAAQSEAQTFVEVLSSTLEARFLIASRLRPDWATARLAVYGDISEIRRAELALSNEESKRILGRHPDLDHVLAQADGWPAVIGLAANARVVQLPGEQLGSGLLHSFFAEELFKSAKGSLQRQLMQLALAPSLQLEELTELFGADTQTFLEDGTDLGFISMGQDGYELHPLVRDFLLGKLAASAEAGPMVASAIEACASKGRWEKAFELILRFERSDLVEPVLEAAYTPLIRSGQVATLASFAAKIRAAPAFPPAVIDLAEADSALADGGFDLASRVAQRAAARFPEAHPLLARANMIVAESAYARARLPEAEGAYRAAFETAQSPDDKIEALRGWSLSSLQGEMPAPAWVMDYLSRGRNHSPLDLVRHTILELTRLHFTAGYSSARPLIEEAEAVLHQVEDPRARSSFSHVAAYVAGLGARYSEAARWQELCDADISAFDLDFAVPHSLWNNAYLALGLRKFGAAERWLQRLEDTIAEHPLDYHVLNTRILRGRLALETGRVAEALSALPEVKREVVIPSIHGEYLATRALALSVEGAAAAALTAASAADEATSAVEVRVLTTAARAIATGRKTVAIDLWELAEELDVWDPWLAAVRSSQTLSQTYAGVAAIRPALAELYQRSNDQGLARRARIRTRASGAPHELLSPRELEVLGLLARGYRNQDIAAALVVSLSTVKVHVRHIFEKLGVRTRSEAVTRLVSLD